MQTAMDRTREFKATRKALGTLMRSRGHAFAFLFDGIKFETERGPGVEVRYQWFPTGPGDNLTMLPIVNGMVVQPQSVEELADALERIIKE